MAHKNVIIMYEINNTNLVVAQMTKWLSGDRKWAWPWQHKWPSCSLQVPKGAMISTSVIMWATFYIAFHCFPKPLQRIQWATHTWHFCGHVGLPESLVVCLYIDMQIDKIGLGGSVRMSLLMPKLHSHTCDQFNRVRYSRKRCMEMRFIQFTLLCHEVLHKVL